MPNHYDDILKKMSTGLFNPNSNFGKDLDPNGFSNSFFGTPQDPQLGPGGYFGGQFGQTGAGGSGGGKDDDTFDDPKGTGPGSGPTGSQGDDNENDPNVYTSVGAYGTNFMNLSELLSQMGADQGSLIDPGAQWGFGAGSGYEEHFQPFDSGTYNRALLELGQMEEDLFRSARSGYDISRQGYGQDLESTLDKLLEKSSVSGLTGGAFNRRTAEARGAAQTQLDKLGQNTQNRFLDIREMMGQRAGELESSVATFLSDAANRALNIRLADPTAVQTTGEDAQTWQNQPKGNPYDAADPAVSGFRSMFDDLSTPDAAYNLFVSLAHTNLNADQLRQLANSIYDQFQGSDESGGA